MVSPPVPQTGYGGFDSPQAHDDRRRRRSSGPVDVGYRNYNGPKVATLGRPSQRSAGRTSSKVAGACQRPTSLTSSVRTPSTSRSRHRSRWRLFSELRRQDGEGGESDGFEATLAAASTGDALVAEDQQEALERALGALPDHQRIPLVLYHYDERSYQEIAALLGVSLGKVKTDIHRGREALKHHVAHHESN